jgi:phage terminase large subunit-like protein
MDRRVEHGILHKAGVRPPLRLVEVPHWHGWQYKSEVDRIVRWCEETLVLPRGHGAGESVRIAPFQRKLLGSMCESLATFVSIPAANGKTTLMAAVALERLCRGDDYVEVDVIATNEHQAQRLVEAAMRMVECSPALQADGMFEFWARDATLEYRVTGSKMKAYPAKLSAVQGLEYSLALVDEIGFVPPELVTGLLARLAKADDARVVGFGTPGMDRASMLEDLRARWRAGDLPAGVRFVEYAAEEGCAINDRKQWRKANPALRAGFLREEALAVQAATMPEHEFRAYHLGQPVESSGPWLPFGAWDACVTALPPPDGAQVVLGVWGSYRRQVAVVGCTMDGAVFFGWQAEKPSDDELGDVLRRAAEQWEVLEVTHKPHIRLGLMVVLEDEGLPVVAWPADRATDVESTAGFYQAIAEQTVAHDHDPGLAEQVSRLTAKVDRQGMPRLVESSDPDVSGALAARAAWWRARVLAEQNITEEIHIW